MSRPDPRTIQKQPQARAGARPRDITVSPPRVAPPGPSIEVFTADGRLDLNAVCQLVEASEVVLEGRIYEATATIGGSNGVPVFLGTALICLDLAMLPVAGTRDAAAARLLRDALARDRRCTQVFRDRAWRETARMLGPETPVGLEVVPTLRSEGLRILIDLDLEGPVEAGSAR